MEWLLLAVPIAALIALYGPHRGHPPRPIAEQRPDEGDGPDEIGVREPRRPAPTSGTAAAAAEPPDEAAA